MPVAFDQADAEPARFEAVTTTRIFEPASRATRR
jgi:hypothetical protein